MSHMFALTNFFGEEYFGKHPFPVTVATRIFRLGIRRELSPVATPGERFYLRSFNFSGLQVLEVPQGLIPFQRVGRMKGGLCLHKYCDSQWSSRGIPYLAPNLTRCDED